MGDAEQPRSRQEIHVLRPTTEEIGRSAAVKAVSIVLQVLTEVVRVSVQAEDADAARDVGARHDPISRPQRTPFAVRNRIGTTYCLDNSDVLVSADERIDDVALVVRSRVLFRLPAVGVLVCTADT